MGVGGTIAIAFFIHHPITLVGMQLFVWYKSNENLKKNDMILECMSWNRK